MAFAKMNRASGGLLLLLPVATDGAEAQRVPEVSLGAPVAAYEDGLGSMRGVRELSDGRVLIADGLGAVLIVWTPGMGADTLTNVGEGPAEYIGPDGLLPLPGDATLLVDLGNARLAHIGPDLEFGDTWPIAQGAAGTMTMVLPGGTDGDGNIYYRQGGMTEAAEWAAVTRLNPASGESTEVGQVRLPAQDRQETGGPGNRSVNVMPVPYSPRDAWAVAWDGRLAVARAPLEPGDGYRLEWIDAGGRVTPGDPVPYDPVRIRRAERDEWLANLGSGGLRVEVVSDGSGAPRMSMSRGRGGDNTADPDDFNWPDVKPPFPGGAAEVDRDGRAWVRLNVPAGDPQRFDVFDGRGRRIAQVELPEDRRFVAFGDDSLYLTRSDEFDFAWLEKYAAPALPN